MLILLSMIFAFFILPFWPSQNFTNVPKVERQTTFPKGPDAEFADSICFSALTSFAVVAFLSGAESVSRIASENAISHVLASFDSTRSSVRLVPLTPTAAAFYLFVCHIL
ncbi:hypothetical protein L596_025483 [Steinernema carpocapsae]|uniref:Amino acid permease/ SLC12A domain-containing protein n=1 Tax=Steinernema carpocapsae TaxID=34508 RepID=A0A4U5M7W5_STECR|nr:hypothetical protein L596_025483 [Steinernema carpocapsae]